MADVELINGEIVAKINVKTCVSGDLRATLRKLINTTRVGEHEVIVLFALCFKAENRSTVRMLLILIPKKVIRYYQIEDIYETIKSKINEKAKHEKFKKIDFLALNEALEFERTKMTLEAREIAKEAKEEARKAREMAERIMKKLDELLNKLR
mgnify:CR=1 FL=1